MTVRVTTDEHDQHTHEDADSVQQLDSGALVVLQEDDAQGAERLHGSRVARTVAMYPTGRWVRVELDDDDPPTLDLGVAGGDDPLEDQVARLAEFITENIDGEPSQSQGAIDTAIRIMSERLGADVDPLAPGRLVRLQGSKGPWQVRERRFELRKEGDPEALHVVLTPYDDEHSITGPDPDEEQPSDGYLDDAEAWTPADPWVTPEALALMRLDRLLGNEHSLSSAGTGRARGIVMGALRTWHQQQQVNRIVNCGDACSEQHTYGPGCVLRQQPADDGGIKGLAQARAMCEVLQRELDEARMQRDEARALASRLRSDFDQRATEGRAQVANLVRDNQVLRTANVELEAERDEARQDADRYARALTTLEQERDRALREVESMRGKRNRARNHAVRAEQQRDELAEELAEVRGERDALQDEATHLRADRAALLSDAQPGDNAGDDGERYGESDDELAGRLTTVLAMFERGHNKPDEWTPGERRSVNWLYSIARGERTIAGGTAGTLLVPPTLGMALSIGDRLSMQDGDGKGVSGRIESWTAAPGGVPFVVVVGAER